MKKILKYLAGISSHGLLIKHNSSSSILAFSDAEWGSDMDDRKSTTRYCVYLGSNLVAWSSHKQRVVSRSSTEAKYRSIVVLTEVFWLQSLLHELHISSRKPHLFSDNLGAVLLSVNPVMHSRTKHFELDLHFVRDHVQQQHVSLVHLPARFQVADILTKPTSKPSFTAFRTKLMVRSPPP